MNPKYHLLVAVAALSLGACSTDDTYTEPEPQNGRYKLSFTVAEDSDTRMTLNAKDILQWEPTDQIGIYTVGNNANSNILTTADVNQSPVEFVGTLEQPISSGDLFYAYYPYNAAQSTDQKAVKLSIPAEQKQTKAGVYNGQSHPLVALPMELSGMQGSDACRVSSVRFRQLGAIVELQLYSSDEALRSESIRSVTFESETPLAGDFTFDLTAVTIDKEPTITGYKSTKATTVLEEPAAIPAAGGEAARIYLTIAPGQYTGQIVVNTDAAKYTFRLAKTMAFERAMIKGLPADLAKAERDMFIHFEDAEVKRICVENWDTNSDGELSYKEAADVTDLKGVFKQNKNIASFNELQYFTGLQSIGESAFYGCWSLKSINLPDRVTMIADRAFFLCSSLTSINIPDGVTAIGYGTFWNCSNLTSITIPDGTTTIGYRAFNGCSSLTSINIPQTVSSIDEGAFSGCTSLSAFYGKYATADHRCLIQDGALLAFAPAGLTEYMIPDGVTTIGVGTFEDCSSLKSITIPDGVTVIGEFAFDDCSNLTSITIPDGMTTIAKSTFSGCSHLTSIHIPEGVTDIGYFAFERCTGLKSINIPQTVSSIDGGAFRECTSLSTFSGKYASEDHRCLIQDGALLAFAPAGLTEYTIPDGVTKIKNYTFDGCSSLTGITIPDGVTEIGAYAFFGCSSLTNVYCKPTTPPTYGFWVFAETPSSMRIYVPATSVEAYKTAGGWSDHATQIFAE